MNVVAGVTTFVRNDAAKVTMDKIVSAWRANNPIEYGQYKTHMRNICAKSQDMYTRTRVYKHVLDIPRAVYYAIATALNEQEWVRNEALKKTFLEVMPEAQFTPERDGRIQVVVDGLQGE